VLPPGAGIGFIDVCWLPGNLAADWSAQAMAGTWRPKLFCRLRWHMIRCRLLVDSSFRHRVVQQAVRHAGLREPSDASPYHSSNGSMLATAKDSIAKAASEADRARTWRLFRSAVDWDVRGREEGGFDVCDLVTADLDDMLSPQTIGMKRTRSSPAPGDEEPCMQPCLKAARSVGKTRVSSSNGTLGSVRDSALIHMRRILDEEDTTSPEWIPFAPKMIAFTGRKIVLDLFSRTKFARPAIDLSQSGAATSRSEMESSPAAPCMPLKQRNAEGAPTKSRITQLLGKPTLNGASDSIDSEALS